jgi:S-phase kinase-associated protein 1
MNNFPIIKMEQTITFVSSDNQQFPVSLGIATQSCVVNNMLSDSCVVNNMLSDVKSDESIDLPIKGNVLEKVIEYCTMFKQKPRESLDVKKPVMLDWEKEFFNMDYKLLSELSNAANFMDIKPLLEGCCCTFAYMIKGKTPEQIREMFNLEDDLTPEEKEQLSKENKWDEY